MDVLVDILLSLLGRAGDALPFGPLKEACEALFRAFAEQVTPQGFGDLVRVVQPTPEGQGEGEEDDDMFEEEAEGDEEIAQGVLPLLCIQQFIRLLHQNSKLSPQAVLVCCCPDVLRQPWCASALAG